MNSTEIVIFTIDTTAPSVVIDNPTATTYTTSQVDINATIIDTTSSVDTVLAEIDNTVNITLVLYGGNLYFNDTYLFSDGAHTIIIFANDTEGNMNSTESVTFTIVTNAPNVTIQYPTTTTYTNSQVDINVTVIESTTSVDTVLAEIDNSVNITLVFDSGNLFINETYIFPDGIHTIRIFANNTEGFMNSTETVTFTVDTTAPSVNIQHPMTTSYNNSQVDINATIIEAASSISTVLAEIDNTINITLVLFSGNLYFNDSYIFSEGNHTVIIFANDSLGFMNSTESITFTVDTINPIVIINSPINNSINASAPLINITAYDDNLDYIWYNVTGNSTMIFLVNNTEVALNQFIWESLPAGWFQISIYANDTAGNINNSLILTIFADKDIIPPTITIDDINIGPVEDITDVADVTVSFTIQDLSGISTLKIRLDSGDWISLNVNATSYIFEGVSIGSHEITINATDIYNNPNTEKQTFTVEREGPEAIIEILLFVAFIGGMIGAIGIIAIYIKKTRLSQEREVKP
jgi:putative lipoic acid-binding regulatory protein